MKYLTLLTFSALLFACGGQSTESAEEMNEDATDAAGEIATEAVTARTDASTFLSSTLQAVTAAGGDITALPAEDAAANINGWISRLSRVDGTEKIVEDLARLKTEFMIGDGEDLNGESISRILTSMADHTRDISEGAPMLKTLANALEAGALKLVE